MWRSSVKLSMISLKRWGVRDDASHQLGWPLAAVLSCYTENAVCEVLWSLPTSLEAFPLVKSCRSTHAKVKITWFLWEPLCFLCSSGWNGANNINKLRSNNFIASVVIFWKGLWVGGWVGGALLESGRGCFIQRSIYLSIYAPHGTQGCNYSYDKKQIRLGWFWIPLIALWGHFEHIRRKFVIKFLSCQLEEKKCQLHPCLNSLSDLALTEVAAGQKSHTRIKWWTHLVLLFILHSLNLIHFLDWIGFSLRIMQEWDMESWRWGWKDQHGSHSGPARPEQ